jgi:hypothetical protein
VSYAQTLEADADQMRLACRAVEHVRARAGETVYNRLRALRTGVASGRCNYTRGKISSSARMGAYPPRQLATVSNQHMALLEPVPQPPVLESHATRQWAGDGGGSGLVNHADEQPYRGAETDDGPTGERVCTARAPKDFDYRTRSNACRKLCGHKLVTLIQGCMCRLELI